MPMLPVHQGWAAIHFTTSRQSSCSCFRYSSCSSPSDSPEPRMSTRRQA